MNIVFKLKMCDMLSDDYYRNCSQEATENMAHHLSSLEQLQVNVSCSYIYDF